VQLYFRFADLLCSSIDMCGFDMFRSCLHSSIHLSLVRLRFVQVGFICVWFDLFLRRLICFLVDRFIFAQFDLYLGKLNLFARVSIYFCAVRLTFYGFDFMLTTFVLFLAV